MRRENPIPLFLTIFYLIIFSVVSLNTSSIDESSLLSLKANINSDILSKNWSEQTPFCTWIGVTCSPTDSRVTGLDLSNMGLQGAMAQEIGNLRHLRVLNLSNNHLNGSIPTSLSACVELKVFDLSHNNLTGVIPEGFGQLLKLEEFILWKNQVTGELPSTIFNISSLHTIDVSDNKMYGKLPQDLCPQPTTKLENLWLYGNQFEGELLYALTRCRSLKILSAMGNKFTGNIPRAFWALSSIQRVGLGRNSFTGTIAPSIANLSNLVLFDIAENNFYGTIPQEIGQLSNLAWLNVKSNDLNGEVPQSLFNISSLQMLTLSLNNLSGFLPFSIDEGIPNIEQLILEGNHFHGKIPSSISNLSKLEILDLSSNFFTGDVPITLGNLSQLQRLTLTGNNFSNNVSKPEQDFLSSLTNCKNLNIINIDSNPITGVLPKSLGSSNLSASLQQFTAHSCGFVGPLPDAIGKWTHLVGLNLGNNELTGDIPVGVLKFLNNLQKLDLFGNNLHGSILHVLCNLKNLYHMDLSENGFFGELPRCLGNLSMLREVNLAYNLFNSTIPPTLWSNEWIEKMNLSSNVFEGSLSREIGNMKSLRELDLSGNRLSGRVPNAISQLKSMVRLSLSNNKMDGTIDESFAVLKELQYLDLSHNNFSGSIPKSFEALADLTYFNVSFNDLSGEIPYGGPFVNFTSGFFIGNKGLCGSPRFKVDECKSSTRTSSSKVKILKYILPVVGSVFIVVVFLVLVLRIRSEKSSTSIFDAPLRLDQERISYHEVLHATKHLDEENLIGKGSYGSVYRGYFSNSKVLAIKVFNLDALNSFDIECQIMCNIRHRNLVKVISSCSYLNFKALVMEYMPNGSLEKWLYSPKCTLNILQRLEIMIDVASALEYLHEGLTLPIAHCDLKPNNILLDDDMVAHVGDFGIAKLLTQEHRMLQTKTLGTTGYMAPEYGSDGLVSTMVDVYSYGILLMEIFSRKRPTDDMFTEELTMRRWVYGSLTNSVTRIVDAELLNMIDENSRANHLRCLTSIIELALKCTSDSPAKRPNMKIVVATMNDIKLKLFNCGS